VQNDKFSAIPTDDELRLRIKNFEDSFVERKTLGDHKDWLKTAVAFANSAPVGFPAILYLGVRDDGTPEPQASNSDLEKLQRSFAEKVKPAYPRIAYYPRVFRIEAQQILAIIIPGSDLRPHFTQNRTFEMGNKH
jgi:predicted HTH transcriptional regulator